MWIIDFRQNWAGWAAGHRRAHPAFVGRLRPAVFCGKAACYACLFVFGQLADNRCLVRPAWLKQRQLDRLIDEQPVGVLQLWIEPHHRAEAALGAIDPPWNAAP